MCVAPAPQCLPMPGGAGSRRPRRRFPKRSSRSGPTCSSAAGCSAGETALFHGGTERHRHDRDPACRRARRARACDRRIGREVPRVRAARRRAARSTTAPQDFVEVVKRADRRPRRRPDPRHRRRRLHRAEPRGARDRRPAGADRVHGRRATAPRRFPTHPRPPADDHRLDAAAAHAWRRRGRLPPRCAREVWPLLERGAVKPVIHRDVSAGRGRRSASADGVERARRQDRPRPMNVATLRRRRRGL